MTINWTEIFQALLGAVITAVVPVISFYIVKYLKVLFENILVKSDVEYFNDTLNQALQLITTAVTSTSQTYVDKLKAEGKFTEEAHIEAFNRTKEIVLSLMNEEMKDLISAAYDDLDQWLDHQIEATVRNLNSENKG